MSQEIERKFLVRNLPNLNNLEAIEYERCFLFIDSNSEIRIQKKGEIYELERKSTQSSLQAEKHKIKISKEEYNTLKKGAEKVIIRTSYNISHNPEISIKIYSGEYIGLSRVEVEFKTSDEANNFIIPEWFGEEITDSPLGRDSKLAQLNQEDFIKLIQK